MGCETINLGSDHPHDPLEVIRLSEEQAGRQAQIEQHPMQAADVMATWANIGEAGRLLGWRPEVSLEEGVVRLCAWYRENRDWARTIARRIDAFGQIASRP
jgi:UDP-glucuronate 4-epimerase